MSAATDTGTPSPIDPPGLSRRRFLLGTLASALAVSGCKGIRPWMARGERPDWLAAVCSDCQAAAGLGRAYLAVHPEEADRALLDKAIARALAPQEDPTQTLFQRLDRRVRSEYARDDTLPVERWILSRTEARLYALAALPAG